MPELEDSNHIIKSKKNRFCSPTYANGTVMLNTENSRKVR